MISERANDGIERAADQWFKRANRDTPELGGALKTRSLQTERLAGGDASNLGGRGQPGVAGGRA